MKAENTARQLAAPKPPPHPGEAVLLRDGKTWIMPAMTLREVDQYDEAMPVILQQSLVPATLDDIARARKTRQEVIRVIHTALVHNYPDLTVEGVAELVDLRNVRPLAQALLALNGFVPEPRPGTGASP